MTEDITGTDRGMDDVFRALSDPSRRALLDRLNRAQRPDAARAVQPGWPWPASR